MRAPRRTATTALVLVALAASPSLAASKKPKLLSPSKPLVVTDKAGDANGVNSQSGLVPADPSQTSPAQHAPADILSFSLGRLDNTKTVFGLTASFTLAAAPSQGLIYRIMASTPTCPVFWISYNVPAGGTAKGSLRNDCDAPGTAVNVDMVAEVKDKVVTIKLPFTALPKGVKLGQLVTVELGESKGHTTTPAASPTVPTIDDVDAKMVTYKIGS